MKKTNSQTKAGRKQTKKQATEAREKENILTIKLDIQKAINKTQLYRKKYEQTRQAEIKETNKLTTEARR